MDADDLYGLALDEFVAERRALAKQLRKAGRRDEATEVAARRKPSVAAWAVNQLVRTQRSAIKELFDAGDELRDAQSDLLAGSGDGRALRAAGDRERAAVEDLVERARGLLSSAGNELSAGVIDRVSDTLHAAALDEEAREQARDGRLERELRHAGLGFGLGTSTTSEPAPRARSIAKAKQKGAAGDAPRAAGARAAGDKQGAAGDAPRAAGARAAGDKQGPVGDAPRTAAGDKHGATQSTQTAAARMRDERERAAEERAEAERVRRERAAARRDARAAHASAKRRADAATRALRAAEERRDEAAQALREADAALAAASEDAAGADDALRLAQAQLDEAQRKG
jgi:hypothetical protein